MDVSALRQYGKSFSEAESSWSPELKARLRKEAMAVVMASLGLGERLRFLWAWLKSRRRAKALDLAPLEARGMRNRAFLRQQLDYLSMFAALTEVVGEDGAIRISKAIMDARSSREAMLVCLPEPERVRAVGDPVDVFRAYFEPVPEASRRAGCNDIVPVEESATVFGFDVTWCVWVELARMMGVPRACEPNYADDLVFPAYFAGLGIDYRRSGTLAGGRPRCDFRFSRRS